jgi:hypothetical protein
MAATATTGMVAGFYHGWVWYRDSNGYPMGTLSTPDSPSTDTVYTPFILPGPVEVTPPTISRETAYSKGGQAIRNKRVLGVNDISDFTFTLSDYSETFNAMVGKTTVDVTTLTNVATTAPNVGLKEPPQMGIAFAIGYQTEAGDNQFLTYYFHNVQISNSIPQGSQSGGENPNPLQYTVTPTRSTRTALGVLYSATALAVTDDSDIMSIYRHEYPFFVSTWVADGTEVDFSTAYLPVDDDNTGTATNSFALNGTVTAVTSFATATGLCTISAHGSSGDIWVVGFPTDFDTA